MNRKRIRWICVLTGTFVIAASGIVTHAEEEKDNAAIWLSAATADSHGQTEVAQPATAEPKGWTKPLPITFGIEYTLVSDYIFRGINFSEYAGEETERLNHQLSVGVSYETESFGTFAFGVWWEWYEGQENPAFDDDAHSHLQEVDYTISWSYDLSNLCESVPVTFETGWIAYTFPQEMDDVYYTHEWYVTLSLDDGALLGLDAPILSPYIAYYLDMDDFQGSWIEWGISHDFALADLGCGGVPVLKDITLTPSYVMGISHRYITTSKGKGTHLANNQFGLNVAFDLSGALNLPDYFGSLTLNGFINYRLAGSDRLQKEVLNDEFWGGMTIGYEW